MRQGLAVVTKNAVMEGDTNHGGGEHSPNTDRVDVVKVSSLEFNMSGAEAERLVDDKVGH